MKINELQKKIKSNEPPHFMVWVGEELAIQDIYLNKLIEMGYNKVCLDSVLQAVQLLNKKSFISDKSVFVVTSDNDYLKQEKMWESVEKQSKNSKNILLLKYPNLDKRSKFYKQYKDTMTLFETLTDEILFKHAQAQLPELSESNVERLISICENNYGRVLLEIDKIKTFQKVKQKEFDECFEKLLADGTISQPINDVTFQFVDSLLYGNPEKTIKLGYQLNLILDSPLGVLSLLYSNFRNMLMVQGLGKDKSSATERTGLTGWQVNNVLKNMGGYSLVELKNALSTIMKAEQGIKSGQIPTEIALDYVILNIL